MLFFLKLLSKYSVNIYFKQNCPSCTVKVSNDFSFPYPILFSLALCVFLNFSAAIGELGRAESTTAITIITPYPTLFI